MMSRTDAHNSLHYSFRISSKFSTLLLSNDPLSLNYCNAWVLYKGNIIE